MNKQRGATLIEVLLVVVVIGIFVLALGRGFLSTSTGSRTGVIQKISHRGAICKTWDGEMALAGFKRTGESTANTWEFTVPDPALVKELEQLAQSQATVTLQYDERWRMPCSGSRYQITGIKTLAVPATIAPAQ